MLDRMKSLVPKSLKPRLKHALGIPTMESRLRNMKAAGFRCSGAVDVGAYSGEWAQAAHSVFGCPVLMFEPQPSQHATLEELAARPPFELERVALSARPGHARFLLQETNSRIVASEQVDGPMIEVPVDTLDAVLARRPFEANLLKVDVQGFELDVLSGAEESLGQFEVVILEVSIIRIGPVPVFREVIEFMAQRRFGLYDIIPMYYRPLDAALWQCDAFFVRDASTLVASNRWN